MLKAVFEPACHIGNVLATVISIVNIFGTERVDCKVCNVQFDAKDSKFSFCTKLPDTVTNCPTLSQIVRWP